MPLVMDNMEIETSDAELHIKKDSSTLMSLRGKRVAPVQVKTHIDADAEKVYIYLKTTTPLKSYTISTNSAIEYSFRSQMIANTPTTLMRWSNIHNPATGKIAGFTATDVFDSTDYSLFIVLDNVDSTFAFVGEQIFKDENGKTMEYALE